MRFGHARLMGFALLLPACGGGGSSSPSPLAPTAAAGGNVLLCGALRGQDDVRVVADGAGGAYLFWTDARDGSGSDVFAQRVNRLGTPLWAPDGVAVSTSGNLEMGGLAAVADGSGGAIVVWSEGLLRAQKINADGQVAWTPGGVPALMTGEVVRFPKAVSDGAGGAVISAREGLPPQDFVKLRSQRLGSGGAQLWGAAGVLVASDLTELEYHDYALASDGANGAIFTWTRQTGFTIDGVYAQRVSGGALAWGAGGVLVAQDTGAQAGSDLVADGSGGAWLAWSDRRNGTADIYGQRLNANGAAQLTSNGVPLVSLPANQTGVRAVPDGAGGMIVTYQDDGLGDGYSDIFAQRVQSGGALPWGPSGVAVVSRADSQTIEVALADAGGVTVVWRDFRSLTSYDLYAQRLSASGAALWASGGEALSVALYDQNSADAALVGGGLLAAWTDWRNKTQSDLYSQVLDVAGVPVPAPPASPPSDPWHAFNAPLAVVPGGQAGPQTVADGAGGLYVLWRDGRVSSSGYYAQRLDPLGAPMWAPGGVRIVSSVFASAKMASDGAGGAVVTWDTGGDIYAQRFDADGMLLWAPGGVPVCQATDDQGSPRLAPDGAGGVVIVWSDYRTRFSTFSDLYAQRLNAAGTPQWTSDGVVVSATTSNENGAQILGDGAGGVFVVWSDDRNNASTGTDLFAQKLDGSGAPQWGSVLSVAAVAGTQDLARVVGDGAGGLIAAWRDTRSGSAIYAQRLTSAGAAQWAAGGAPICLVGAGDVEMVPDEAGGAILAWVESRGGGPPTLYAQRVSPAGGTLWPAEGVALSVRPLAPSRPSLLSDGSGGAFLAWAEDLLIEDIYLQRIDGSGTLALAAGGIPVSTAQARQMTPVLAGFGASHFLAFWEDARRGNGEVVLYFQRLGFDGAP